MRFHSFARSRGTLCTGRPGLRRRRAGQHRGLQHHRHGYRCAGHCGVRLLHLKHRHCHSDDRAIVGRSADAGPRHGFIRSHVPRCAGFRRTRRGRGLGALGLTNAGDRRCSHHGCNMRLDLRQSLGNQGRTANARVGIAILSQNVAKGVDPRTRTRFVYALICGCRTTTTFLSFNAMAAPAPIRRPASARALPCQSPVLCPIVE